MNRFLVAAVGAAALALATNSTFAQTGTQGGQAAQSTQGAKSAKGTRATNAGAAAKKKPSTQQEVESSVESGTVPARYRSSIPKQYQQYIPFGQ